MVQLGVELTGVADLLQVRPFAFDVPEQGLYPGLILRGVRPAELLAIAYARDGYALLEAVYDPSSPPWLRELPAVDVLRGCCCRTTPGPSPQAGGR